MKYPLNSKHTVRVVDMNHLRAYVKTKNGERGSIALEELSWSQNYVHPSDFCKIGDFLEAIVLKIDKYSIIHFSRRKAKENTQALFIQSTAKGAIHRGKVICLKNRKGIIQLAKEATGICPGARMFKPDGSSIKIGDELDFKIVEIRTSSLRVIVFPVPLER